MADLSRPVPKVPASEAESLATRVLGLWAMASMLNSERDRSFRLKTETNAGWILDIVNTTEPLVESKFPTALRHHIARLIKKGHRRIALVDSLLRLTYSTVTLSKPGSTLDAFIPRRMAGEPVETLQQFSCRT